jgi:hypothetical protein
MRARVYLFLFAASLLACSSVAANPDTSESVKSIEITSSWGGLGGLSKTDLVVRNEKGRYYSGRKQIDASLVLALVHALDEPPLSEPQLANLGITQSWLEEKATPSALGHTPYSATTNQKDLYLKTFTDPSAIEKIVPRLFQFIRTDDYPFTHVNVIFHDDRVLEFESGAWYEFMLPWNVTRGGDTTKTYNANISRALAALMPPRATNRSRIAGAGLESELADAVMENIKTQWKILGVENRAGDVLALLRNQYVVEGADINDYHNNYYGREWVKGQLRETNFHVTLRKLSFPTDFSEEAILAFGDGKVRGVDEFLRQIGSYEQLVNSVPWLAQYREQNPSVLLQLIFVHDQSFGDKAMSVFASDMKLIGKPELIDQVRLEQDRVALIDGGYGGFWLVLPDKTMILWRYSARAGLLKWFGGGLPTRKCSDYNHVTGGCVGAVISPDGTLKD